MIKTLKLYDDDAYLTHFEAEVILCEEREGCFAAVLNRTAFFPEGGGQPSDKGVLDGIEVFDVREENGNIYHFLNKPLEPGKTVSGEIDFSRRFAFMQNHSGEHIISGIVNRLFGLDNVGFHLNEELATLDFNGMLSPEQLTEVEALANEAVWQNRKITTYYPEKEELKNINYRSKKELEGDIRIVEIEGADICACCAPHVKETAQIGLIKLLDTEKMRGGIRITMKCGPYALKDYNDKYSNISRIAKQLSAKQENAAEAVMLLEGRLNEEKQKASQLKKRIIEYIISSAEQDNPLIFEDELDIKELQLLSDGLCKKFGDIRGAFSPAAEGFSFAICSNADYLDKFFKVFKPRLNIRGGGRNGMVQGTVLNTREEIIGAFESAIKETDG